MFQLSLMGRGLQPHLYFRPDNQFYPKYEKGGVMLIDCDPENGGMKVNPNFMINLAKNQMGLADAMKPATLVVIARVTYGYDKI